MAALYVFPDTNLLIHFRRLNEIDWLGLTGARSVVVVLAPVVVEELDDLKNRQESRKIKQRARDLNSWVRERWRGDKVLREGVTLEFATFEDDQHLTGGLVARIKDDRLIASALGYKADGREVALATNDTGPLIKAEARGLRVIEPPADLALPLERDDIEKERDDLRRQSELARSRAPKLVVAWPGDGGGLFKIPAHEPLHHADHFKRAYPRMLKAGEQGPYGLASVSVYAAMGVPNSAIDAYNEELERYYAELETGYQKALAAFHYNRRLIDLKLVLKNDGTASATHISVRVDLPPTIKTRADLKKIEIPEPPPPPKPPGPFGIMAPIDLNVVTGRRVAQELFLPVPVFDPYAPTIEPHGRSASWSCNRLTHADREDLGPLRCLIADELVGSTAVLKVTVHAEEQLAPISHELEVSCAEFASKIPPS